MKWRERGATDCPIFACATAATVSFYKNLEKGLPPGAGVFVVCDAVTGAPLGIFQENRCVKGAAEPLLYEREQALTCHSCMLYAGT